MGLLTDDKVKPATPHGKEYLLSDSDGLYLRVRPSGKTWLYIYKHQGTKTKLGLGSYPVVSLATARQKARAEAEKRASGIDPKQARRPEEEPERVSRLNTFERMARAWTDKYNVNRGWSEEIGRET